MTELFLNYVTQPTAWYVAAVIIGALVGGLWLRRWIARTESRRRRHVERVKRFESVRTETPLDDPNELARERGLESIETRFAVIQRLLVPTFLVCCALVVLVPFLRNIPAAFVSALLGVFTVIVGIAAKPFIENVIAGLVLSFSQPIRIGDTVKVDGNYGTVENVSLAFTTIKLWDWRRFIVPNQVMLQKQFLNYSIVDRYIWTYVDFWVAPNSDLDAVRELAVNAVQQSPHFAAYESPAFWVMEMGKEGVCCWVAGWANTPSAAWALAHETRSMLCRGLRSQGISTHAHHHTFFDAGVTPSAGSAKEPSSRT